MELHIFFGPNGVIHIYINIDTFVRLSVNCCLLGVLDNEMSNLIVVNTRTVWKSD